MWAELKFGDTAGTCSCEYFCQRFALFWRNFEIVLIHVLFWCRISTQNLQWRTVFFYKFLAWMREQKMKSIITLKYLYTTLDNIRLKNVPKSLNLALWMKWNVSAILVPIPLWNKWFHLWILQGNFSAKSKTSKESIKTFDFKIKTYFITDVLH